MVGKRLFFNWSEAFTAGVEAVGGKGWNLSRLNRYGFTIPVGGVLSADSYRAFIKENNLSEAISKISTRVTVANITEKEIEEELLKLREKIKAGLFPVYIQEKLIAELKRMGIDIEWVFDGQDFVLVQARPVNTLYLEYTRGHAPY